jgi:hypothetical protein
MPTWATIACPHCGARVAAPMLLRPCGCITVDQDGLTAALSRHVETSEVQHPSLYEEVR